MKKGLSRAALVRLAKTGEWLYAEIRQKNKLPQGEFIAINCEPKSKGYGKFVCAPLASDAADEFEHQFGEDLMWLRQLDWSVNPRQSRLPSR